MYISSRRGVWLLGRLADDGLPFDITFNNRLKNAVRQLLPRSVQSHMARTAVNSRFNHKFYGLEPDYDVGLQLPAVNDEAPGKIASGKILIKAGIQRITANGAVFVDGTSISDVDSIIFATG